MKLGIFKASPAFRAIEHHICISDDSGKLLVAAFGDIKDPMAASDAARFLQCVEALRGVPNESLQAAGDMARKIFSNKKIDG